jgi:methionine-rich copper-binding protein CopC
MLAWTLLTAAPASAHADLLLSSPEDGAVLTAVPEDAVLTFSEDLLPETVVVSVADETGFVVRVLSLEVDGADVLITWPPGLSGSAYDINYRVVSQDGHPVEGTVAFTVEGGPVPSSVAGSTAPAQAATEPESSTSVAPIAAISAGLGIGIATGFLLWVMRRRGGTVTPGDPT